MGNGEGVEGVCVEARVEILGRLGKETDART